MHLIKNIKQTYKNKQKTLINIKQKLVKHKTMKLTQITQPQIKQKAFFKKVHNKEYLAKAKKITL